MNAPPLTRRRALAVGAAAGLLPWLSRAVPSAVAAGPPRARTGQFGLDVPRAAFGADGRTAVLRAPRRFDVLGVRGAPAGGLEVRTRGARGWSRWVPVGRGGSHRPDTGTPAPASDPVWVGDGRALQLRAATAPSGALRVHFVALSAADKRRAAHAATRARAAQAVAAPAIIPRAAWGGDGVPPRGTPSYGDVQLAFVHHTVSANDYTAADSAAIVLGIARYHRDVNGWNDIGYNFLVDAFGQIFEGRAGGIDQAIVGAQAQGWNSHSTGIANLGTYETVGVSAAALDAMARLIAWKLPLHGTPVTGSVVVVSGGGEDNRYAAGTPVSFQRISGHRDGCATACPGSALYAQLPDLRARAAALAPAAPVAPVALALESPAPSVAYGADLALRGTLHLGDGTAVAAQAVRVQKLGTSGWVTVARTATDAEGTWVATVPWKRTGQVRALASVPERPVAVTPGASVACLPVLRASTKTARIRAGRTLTVTGSVRPIAPVTLVVEKQGSDGRYRRVSSVTVTPRAAAFLGRVVLPRPGLYRVTAQTGSAPARVAAPALYVRAVRPGASLTPASPPGIAARR